MTSDGQSASNLIGQRFSLTGNFREPVTAEGVRPLSSSVKLKFSRIDEKGRAGGQPVHLGTNEWPKARLSKGTSWIYVVWDPLKANPKTEPVRIHDPAHRLEYTARAVRVLSGHGIPAEATQRATP